MSILLTVALICGQASPMPNPYLKTTTDSKGIFTLETGAHHLTATGKPDVWLVGAAHIGSKTYYKGLQTLLDAQAQVLFEGVKPKAGAPPRPKPTSNPKPGDKKPIYQVLGDALGLDFQLTDINYNHPNWIDSDLSMDDLEALNKAAGGGKPTQFDLLEKILDPNSPVAQQFAAAVKMMTPGGLEGLKLFLVERLSTLDPSSVLGDAATTQVVLKARNQSVESYFDKSVSTATPPKSIAIFYGALHQQDIENDLKSKYGYKLADARWFKAATADSSKLDATGHTLFNMLDAQFKSKQSGADPKHP